ncbi:MAG: glycosyltransferase, partial [Pseudomonadales bacterium]|nr:glycosyltransferase [Pseudomonadales bacterium]
RESAGMVLLEATVAGLPVLTTDTCGYARYVQEAGSGEVIASPFEQAALNTMLQTMVERVPGEWQANALRYAESPQLYQLAQNVVDAVEAGR